MRHAQSCSMQNGPRFIGITLQPEHLDKHVMDSEAPLPHRCLSAVHRLAMFRGQIRKTNHPVGISVEKGTLLFIFTLMHCLQGPALQSLRSKREKRGESLRVLRSFLPGPSAVLCHTQMLQRAPEHLCRDDAGLSLWAVQGDYSRVITWLKPWKGAGHQFCMQEREKMYLVVFPGSSFV